MMGTGKSASIIKLTEELDLLEIPYICFTAIGNKIESRNGKNIPARNIKDIYKEDICLNNKVIIIDEIHFVDWDDIEYFAKKLKKISGSVIMWGLKYDYQHNVFPVIKKIIKNNCSIMSMKNLKCTNCENEAFVDARVNQDGGLIVGEQLDENAKYISLCKKCWNDKGGG